MSFIPWTFAFLLLIAEESFISFEICEIDYNAIPYEARGNGDLVFLRRSVIDSISGIKNTTGETCTRICSPIRCRNVVGSEREVIQKILEERN